MALRPIVVYTDSDDVHVDYVQRHMSQKLFLVSPLGVMGGDGLSMAFDGRYRVIYRGDDITDTQAVWLRKPARIEDKHMPGWVPELIRGYGASGLRNLLSFFPGALSDDTVWISDVYAVARAGSKAWQLRLADEFDLNVPPTLITSDSAQAREFVRDLEARGERCVIKRTSTEPPVVGDQEYVQYTRVVKPSTKLGGMDLSPAILQQIIQTDYSLRATVVGEQIFVSRSDYQPDPDSDVRDWRKSKDQGWYPWQLPNDEASVLIALARRQGLFFATIDLLVDRRKKQWFLEVNPNGQWAFLDEVTVRHIGKALAQLLEHPPERRMVG